MDCGTLTNRQIVQLARAIASIDLEAIALEYFHIDEEAIRNLRSDHRENAERLASILFTAARRYGNVNPDKIEEILGVPNEQILEVEESIPVASTRVEKFTMEQFLSVARLVRPDTEQTMKIEVAPWIKDYVTDMDDLYTDLKLTKLQNNVTLINTGYLLKCYSEIFQEIEIEQEKKRKAEEEKRGREEELEEEKSREEHNRSLYLHCLQMALSCRKNRVGVVEVDLADIVVTEIVKAGKRFLTKGDPGMGKTSFVKKIAYDWAIGMFDLFRIVFFVFLKLVKPGQSIEKAIIEQTPALERLGVSPTKLNEAFKKFGGECLVTLDGLDEHASGQNSDVIEVIKGRKLYQCHVLITSRPHSTRHFEQYFNTIVNVEGFSRAEAKEFAFKIFPDRITVQKVLNYNPPYFSRQRSLHTCPTLLSFMCLLVREEEIDLTDEIRKTGEIYVRMVRCLYKKFTIRKGIEYSASNFIKVLKSVGRLALKTLLSGNPLLKRSDVLAEVGVDAFNYGLLIGHEDAHRLICDETADIFVTFSHRSLQEFLGVFFFIQELNDGNSVENLLGPACNEPIFMTNPLFLHFCLWLLLNSEKYFTFTNKDDICRTLQRFISGKLTRSELSLTKLAEQYPAVSITDVLEKGDQSVWDFFSRDFSQCKEVRTLVIGEEYPLDSILTIIRQLLGSVMYAHVDKEVGISVVNKFQLALSVNKFDGTLEYTRETLYRNEINFTSFNSIDVFTGVMLKIALESVFDVSTGSRRIYSFSRFLRLSSQECKLKKLCIDSIDVENKDLIPICPYLTHLILRNLTLDRNTVVGLCLVVKRGKLPRLAHLSIVKCENLLLSELFESEWSELSQLDIRRCDLEVSDFDILCNALKPLDRQLLPSLSALALTFNNIPEYTDALTNLLVTSDLPLTTLFLETTNSEENINFIGKMDWTNMPNLIHLGISLRWCLDDIFLDGLGRVESLVLHDCVDNRKTLFDIGKKCGGLTFLDITHCEVISGHLPQFLENSFPLFTSLVLSDCWLNSGDVKSLAEAKEEGRLPQLKHLDISYNMLTTSDLNCLGKVCPWDDLLTLNIRGTDIAGNISLVDNFCFVRELCVFDYPLNRVTAEWPHLRILCLGMSDENVLNTALQNIRNAVQEGFFPVLSSICFDFLVQDKEVWEIPVVRRLSELNISCHTKVPTENPFTPYLCICQPERFPC